MGAVQGTGPRTLTDRLVVGAQRDAFVRGYVQGGGATLDIMLQAAEQAKVEYPLYKYEPKVITHVMLQITFEYRFVEGELQYRQPGEWEWKPLQIDLDYMRAIIALHADPTELVKTDE